MLLVVGLIVGCSPARHWELYTSPELTGPCGIAIVASSCEIWGKTRYDYPTIRVTAENGDVLEFIPYDEDPKHWVLYRVNPDNTKTKLPLVLVEKGWGSAPETWNPQ